MTLGMPDFHQDLLWFWWCNPWRLHCLRIEWLWISHVVFIKFMYIVFWIHSFFVKFNCVIGWWFVESLVCCYWKLRSLAVIPHETSSPWRARRVRSEHQAPCRASDLATTCHNLGAFSTSESCKKNHLLIKCHSIIIIFNHDFRDCRGKSHKIFRIQTFIFLEPLPRSSEPL